jgi:uncharacterized protein YecE (DUF72 family)
MGKGLNHYILEENNRLIYENKQLKMENEQLVKKVDKLTEDNEKLFVKLNNEFKGVDNTKLKVIKHLCENGTNVMGERQFNGPYTITFY